MVTFSVFQSTIILHGELDFSFPPEIIDCLLALGKEVTFDLSNVTSIDSSGLLLFIAALQHEMKVTIVGANDGIKKILYLSNLDKKLKIE